MFRNLSCFFLRNAQLPSKFWSTPPPPSMPITTSQRHFLRTTDPAQILPLNVSDTRHTLASRLPKRACRLLVFLFLSSSAFVWFYSRHIGEDLPAFGDITVDYSLPPLYEAYHDYERHLPQHNLSLPFPEGRDAKFFWVPNHVTSERVPLMTCGPWDESSP